MQTDDLVLGGDSLGKENELRDDDGSHESEGGDGDGKDLDVENDQAAPSSARKAAPGVLHGGVALATDDAGLNLVLEGAVEGDDGVSLLGDQRGLDANEDDAGGDDNDDLEGDADDGDDDALPGVGGLGLAAELQVREVEAEEVADSDGDPGRELLGDPVDDDRADSGVEGALEGREAGPEVQGAPGRDDNVDPGSAELDKRQGGEKGPDGGDSGVEEGAEDAVENGGGEDLGEQTEETTEVCAPTTVRSQEAVDGAEGRGHGGGPAFSDLCGDGAVAAWLWAGSSGFVIDEVDGVVGRGVLVLDNGKDGVDLAKGVGRLVFVLEGGLL